MIALVVSLLVTPTPLPPSPTPLPPHISPCVLAPELVDGDCPLVLR